MPYQDSTVTINELQGDGYPVSALADGIGRVATVLPNPDDELATELAVLANLAPTADGETIVRAAGEALFNWLVVGPVNTHLRLAWDRAQRDGQRLRLRLCIDSPEIGAWSWEASRLQSLADSPQRSLETEEDWGLVDPGVLATWQATLLRAEENYRDWLADPRPEVQLVARHGMAVIESRLAAIDKVLA